jgi:hypothetical protein
MDEEDHSAEKKQLEKGFEKKIQDMKETQSEETKATAKTSAPKRTGFSKKASKKVKRAIALTLCVMIIFPSILLINSYDTSCSRQLLVSPHLGYLVWQDDVNTRIDPNFAPLSAEKNVDPSISLRSAKNEVEYSRFAIRSLYTDTKSVEFSISNLQLTDGSAIIAQSNIKIYNVQSALSDQIQDVLVEIEMGKKLSIETEKNAVFLIQIQTPASAVAGEYSGNFTLILDSLEFTIEIGLNVFDFSLPSLNSKTIIYGGNEIKTQSDIEKLSSVGIYSAKIPLNFTYEASTQLTTFEWTTFDSLMQSAISQGFSKIDVSIELDLPESFVVLGQEYNASYLDAYSKIAQHIKANNWITKVYVDMGHQTGSEELYASSGLIKLIKQADSDLSITFGTKLNATNIERFGLVNHWIISIKDLDSEFPLFKEMKRSGKSVLLFVDDSIQMPFLNLKLTNPLVHARLIPWLIYQFNLDGFYYFDTVNMQPNAFGYGPDGLSSGLLIYSNEEGDFHPSERFEILKQGFEDLSYLLAFRGLEESTQKTELISRINVLIARFSSVSLDSQKYIGIRNDIAQLLQA